MPDMMPRRAFVTLLGGAAIWSHAALAQKSDGARRVGVIMGFAENDEVWQVYLAAFRQAMQDLGWTDGRNVRFDYRFTGDSEQLMRSIAEEIVGLAPDVMLVSTNSVVAATLKATRSIPIVSHGYPIRSEAVSSRTCLIPAEKLRASTISSRRSAGNGLLISARSRRGCAVSLLCTFRKSHLT
jgi:ABC-type uncharacterized transport system substrate-binding protein